MEVFIKIGNKEQAFKNGMPLGVFVPFAVSGLGFIFRMDFWKFQAGISNAAEDQILSAKTVRSFFKECALHVGVLGNELAWIIIKIFINELYYGLDYFSFKFINKSFFISMDENKIPSQTD